MSLPKLTKSFLNELNSDKFDFFAVNFANPDMVAHTGNLKATITAIENVDYYLYQIVKNVLEVNGGFSDKNDIKVGQTISGLEQL